LEIGFEISFVGISFGLRLLTNFISGTAHIFGIVPSAGVCNEKEILNESDILIAYNFLIHARKPLLVERSNPPAKP
jgi:hypothetical protein